MSNNDRANSRLGGKVEKVETAVKKPSAIPISVPKTEHKVKKPNWYLKHLHLLALGIVGYGGLIWLVFNVAPPTVADWPVKNAYGVVHGLFWWGNFWMFSFLLKKSRRGWAAALTLSALLFAQRQHVSWTTPTIATLIAVIWIPILLLELIKLRDQS